MPRLFRDESGAILVLCALCFFMLAGFAGLAVDTRRIQNAQYHLQSAVDSAALSAARALDDASIKPKDAEAFAERVFASNISTMAGDVACATHSGAKTGLSFLQVSVDKNTQSGTVEAGCSVPRTFMALFGPDDVGVTAKAKAVADISNLDIAFMADVTASMDMNPLPVSTGGSRSRIAVLKDSLEHAMSVLITPQSGDRVRAAIVPFGGSVNATGMHERIWSPWPDLWQTRYDFNDNGVIDIDDRICAKLRSGALATSNAPPGTGSFPDPETHGGGFGANSWYAPTCHAAPIVPLTSDLNKLDKGVARLEAKAGLTDIGVGLAWSWYMISEEWASVFPPGSSPLPSAGSENIKAVVLMTDGAFSHNGNFDDGIQTFRNLCDAIKADGVQLFAVVIGQPGGSDQAAFEYCMQPNLSRLHIVKTADGVMSAYESIASDLKNVRLVDP